MFQEERKEAFLSYKLEFCQNTIDVILVTQIMIVLLTKFIACTK